MKMKFLITTLALIFTSLSFAANMTVKMSKNCRTSDGSYQSYSDSAQVNLVPYDVTSHVALDQLAKKAAQNGGYVTFKVDGAVLSDETVYHPRTGYNQVIRFLVKIVQ